MKRIVITLLLLCMCGFCLWGAVYCMETGSKLYQHKKESSKKKMEIAERYLQEDNSVLDNKQQEIQQNEGKQQQAIEPVPKTGEVERLLFYSVLLGVSSTIVIRVRNLSRKKGAK